MAMHISHIQLVHFAIGKQAAKPFQAQRIPGQQQQTGGVAIKTMHEAELRQHSLNPADQGIALGGTKTRLTQQAGRLLDHHKMGMPAMNQKP
jgi:hypothetical protein